MSTNICFYSALTCLWSFEIQVISIIASWFSGFGFHGYRQDNFEFCFDKHLSGIPIPTLLSCYKKFVFRCRFSLFKQVMPAVVCSLTSSFIWYEQISCTHLLLLAVLILFAITCIILYMQQKMEKRVKNLVHFAFKHECMVSQRDDPRRCYLKWTMHYL